MPNRILKESICTSEDLNGLAPMAEILFYRLMVNVDDYGCFYGNESIIKSNCFPLKSDDIKCEQVDSWLDELDAAGLIIRYFGEDGRKYIKLRKWDKHQQIRAKKRKFPEPPSVCERLISDDINRNQEQAEDSKCPRNPIQSNPNPNPNTNTPLPPKRGSGVFVKPSVEEVQAYCEERNNGIEAEAFIDFYESKGWKIGKDSMKDWKAAVRNWERSKKERAGANNQSGTSKRDRKSQEVARKYADRDFFSD